MLELQVTSIMEIVEHLRGVASDRESHLPYGDLEYALLKFPHPSMKYVIKHPPRTQSISFWARELGKDMRVLFKRGALALTSETGGFRHILTVWDKLTSCPVLPAGHDRDVRCLVISPDSK